MDPGGYSVRYGIEQHGIKNVGRVFWTPSTPVLYEEIVQRREGLISHLGPIVVRRNIS
jgi:phosphoenolpyruvate carboxykinase (ATP)